MNLVILREKFKFADNVIKLAKNVMVSLSISAKNVMLRNKD